jgi:excinuclease ABC subunit C
MNEPNKIVNLSKKARTLPTKPGCYLMYDAKGNVLYVGKAKSLRSRVGSYFKDKLDSVKTEMLVSKIESFDFMITSNEAEALVLENNLIKKHAPKYNIRLRDDKSYPYLVIDHRHDFPTLSYQRNPKPRSRLEILGPFATGSNIGEVIRVLIKAFELRDCSDQEFTRRKEPCLLYQMKQCSAPCVEKIGKDDYQKLLKKALNIFYGKGNSTLGYLKKKMESLAESEFFEQAALVRDQLQVLENFLTYAGQFHAEVHSKIRNIDIWGMSVQDTEIDLSLYIIRNGLLLGHKNLNFTSYTSYVDEEGRQEVELISKIFEYYELNPDAPELVILPDGIDAPGPEFIQEMEQLKIKFQTVNGSKYESFQKLATDHAGEQQRLRLSGQGARFKGLDQLKDLLQLNGLPLLLECFDIAIWQGKAPTGSQIVFQEGLPFKKNYRHYHLKERPEGNNDFAMMQELLERRVEKGQLPDVFVVDGGKGQVGVFVNGLKQFGLDIPVVGIAKEKTQADFKSKEIEKSEERLIIPGRKDAVPLRKHPELMKILVSMRDEAHRFSRRLHHHKTSKDYFTSFLDSISGIGPVLKKRLLQQTKGNFSVLQKMNVEEIAKHLEVSPKLAKNIYEAMQKEAPSV